MVSASYRSARECPRCPDALPENACFHLPNKQTVQYTYFMGRKRKKAMEKAAAAREDPFGSELKAEGLSRVVRCPMLTSDLLLFQVITREGARFHPVLIGLGPMDMTVFSI